MSKQARQQISNGIESIQLITITRNKATNYEEINRKYITRFSSFREEQAFYLVD